MLLNELLYLTWNISVTAVFMCTMRNVTELTNFCLSTILHRRRLITLKLCLVRPNEWLFSDTCTVLQLHIWLVTTSPLHTLCQTWMNRPHCSPQGCQSLTIYSGIIQSQYTLIQQSATAPKVSQSSYPLIVSSHGGWSQNFLSQPIGLSRSVFIWPLLCSYTLTLPAAHHCNSQWLYLIQPTKHSLSRLLWDYASSLHNLSGWGSLKKKTCCPNAGLNSSQLLPTLFNPHKHYFPLSSRMSFCLFSSAPWSLNTLRCILCGLGYGPLHPYH